MHVDAVFLDCAFVDRRCFHAGVVTLDRAIVVAAALGLDVRPE